MNNEYSYFTLEELESLSKAFLECRLSKLQEKELELVLSSCQISSPVIDEARDTMGITTILESVSSPKKIKSCKRFRWAKWCAAAACILFAAGFCLRDVPTEANTSIVVFVDGKRLDTHLAEKRAAETQALCMALLQESIDNARSVQDESIRFLN